MSIPNINNPKLIYLLRQLTNLIILPLLSFVYLPGIGNVMPKAGEPLAIDGDCTLRIIERNRNHIRNPFTSSFVPLIVNNKTDLAVLRCGLMKYRMYKCSRININN